MTQPEPQRYVLHPSVASRWWLTTLPHADLANRFLHSDLASGLALLYATDTFEAAVLGQLAQALGPEYLDVQIAGALFADVHRLVETMVEERILTLTRHAVLARPAFLLATAYNVPFADAMVVAHAEAFGPAVLVADDDAYARLLSAVIDRSAVRIVHVAGYYRSSP